MTFTKATRSPDQFLRMALMGVSKSGKTLSALRIATGIADAMNLDRERVIAMIDTEHARSTLYADEFDYDVMRLESFAPRRFVDAIKSAAEEHYPILIVDSMSHEWMGPGGVLETVDALKEKGDKVPWGKVTPLHNAFIDTLLDYPGHVIVTIRMKPKIELIENDGKIAGVRKLGIQPIQRDDVEYEFDVIGTLHLHDNSLTIENMARYKALRGWASDGPVDESFGAFLIDVLKGETK